MTGIVDAVNVCIGRFATLVTFGNDLFCYTFAQPLIEHLTELRQRLIYAAGAFIVAMVFCYMFWKPAFFFLTEPVCAALASRGQDCALSLIKMQEGFFVAIKIAMWGGFAMSFPVIAYQMWRFIAPGLYRSEKSAFLPFLLANFGAGGAGGGFRSFRGKGFDKTGFQRDGLAAVPKGETVMVSVPVLPVD